MRAIPSFLALACVLGCTSATPAPAADDSPDAGPFEPMPPSVYVGKVKNVLVGLPPTDVEIQAVTADSAALGGLVDGWMALPQYRQKMLRFFQLAFQQTQLTPS